jgi:hypothetical protein
MNINLNDLFSNNKELVVYSWERIKHTYKGLQEEASQFDLSTGSEEVRGNTVKLKILTQLFKDVKLYHGCPWDKDLEVYLKGS